MKILQRYLTWQKFILLCEDQGFFLAPLTVQSDPEEGIYNSAVPEQFVQEIATESPSLELDSGRLKDIKIEVDDLQNKMMINNRDHTFISSWFIGQEESQEMWEQYSDDNGAVIFSRDDLLISELPPCLNVLDSFEFRDVTYGDKQKNQIQHQPASFKKEAFKKEQEHRIIFNLTTFELLTGQHELEVFIGNEPANQYLEKSGAISKTDLDICKQFLIEKGNGFVVKYDLSKTITEVRVNVKASPKAKQEIKRLCESKNLNYRISKQV